MTNTRSNAPLSHEKSGSTNLRVVKRMQMQAVMSSKPPESFQVGLSQGGSPGESDYKAGTSRCDFNSTKVLKHKPFLWYWGIWILGRWGVCVCGDRKRYIWPKVGVRNDCVRVSHLGSICSQWGGSDTCREWLILYCTYGSDQMNCLLLVSLHWLWKEPSATYYLCRYLPVGK